MMSLKIGIFLISSSTVCSNPRSPGLRTPVTFLAAGGPGHADKTGHLRLTEQILNTIRFQQTDAEILEVSRRLTV
jgi:hypothetical protein